MSGGAQLDRQRMAPPPGGVGTLTVVVMAKPAAPGRVKTRLMPALTARQAAGVHAAMTACVLQRVGRAFQANQAKLVVALAGGQPAAEGGGKREGPWMRDLGLGPADFAGGLSDPARALAEIGWRVIDQGGGDLGRRMEHVWRRIGGGAAVFFGVDSPDVSLQALRAVAPALEHHDAAIGPAMDGGYWTLAARRHLPGLLQGIDWGGTRVYDQTLVAARRMGLSAAALPTWPDVDTPADLAALRRRLHHEPRPGDPALRRLGERLKRLGPDLGQGS